MINQPCFKASPFYLECPLSDLDFTQGLTLAIWVELKLDLTYKDTQVRQNYICQIWCPIRRQVKKS
jgi:hypothetical protein